MEDISRWRNHRYRVLADYGREEEAAAELARAASCEDQVAYLLDAVGREQEAVVHRVSAASCYEQLGERARAATLLRAVLSAQLTNEYRRRVKQQLADCLAHATAHDIPPPAPRKLASVS